MDSLKNLLLNSSIFDKKLRPKTASNFIKENYYSRRSRLIKRERIWKNYNY